MKREFNITGICVPNMHYRVDISEKLEQIFKLVESAKYFTINRGHRYGKTTTIGRLRKRFITTLQEQRAENCSYHRQSRRSIIQLLFSRMKQVRKAFLCLCLFLTFNLNAQKIKVSSYYFFGQTNDIILWDGIEYMCSQSPLMEFKGYKTLFGNLPSKYTIDPESPVDLEKNYQVKWMIKDKALLLCDVEILNGKENYPEKRKPQIQLLNATGLFNKRKNLFFGVSKLRFFLGLLLIFF